MGGHKDQAQELVDHLIVRGGKNSMKTLFLFIPIVVLIAGCAGTPWHVGRDCWDPWTPTALEKDFGTSYRASVMNQTANPDASKNLSPVTGMDGQTAEKVLDMYEKRIKEKESAPTYIFNVGEGMGGSK